MWIWGGSGRYRVSVIRGGSGIWGGSERRGGSEICNDSEIWDHSERCNWLRDIWWLRDTLLIIWKYEGSDNTIDIWSLMYSIRDPVAYGHDVAQGIVVAHMRTHGYVVAYWLVYTIHICGGSHGGKRIYGNFFYFFLKLFFNSEVRRSLWKYEGSEICC